ncbi:MAG: hypothetical protein DLM64_05595, partial [Solirubrobacterales bacterium]
VPRAASARAWPGAGAAEAGAAGAGAQGNGSGDGDEEAGPMPPVEQRRVDQAEQLGRNDPCWCGSGAKFKKCHGA